MVQKTVSCERQRKVNWCTEQHQIMSLWRFPKHFYVAPYIINSSGDNVYQWTIFFYLTQAENVLTKYNQWYHIERAWFVKAFFGIKLFPRIM